MFVKENRKQKDSGMYAASATALAYLFFGLPLKTANGLCVSLQGMGAVPASSTGEMANYGFNKREASGREAIAPSKGDPVEIELERQLAAMRGVQLSLVITFRSKNSCQQVRSVSSFFLLFFFTSL